MIYNNSTPQQGRGFKRFRILSTQVLSGVSVVLSALLLSSLWSNDLCVLLVAVVVEVGFSFPFELFVSVFGFCFLV